MLKKYFLCFFLLISCVGFAQKAKTLAPRAISKLIPSKVKGYSVKNDSKSSVLSIGSLRYSVSEKIFSSNNKSIKVLLFDYVEAPIMYNQSVRKWTEIPDTKSDSVSFNNSAIEYGQLWESEYPRANRSKLFFAVNNRFFLTLEAENMSLGELKEFFKNFDLEKYPK